MSCSKVLPGILYIFNIENVRNNPDMSRIGSHVDVDNLKSTFRKMNAVVVDPVIDFTADEFDSKVLEITKTDFTAYSYVAIAFLSHGHEDGTVGTTIDGEIMSMQKSILIPLCRIKSLNGKLKWLIMQTCKGSYDFIEEATEGEDEEVVKYPLYCAKFFASTEGMKAYRIPGGESLFITALCNRLRSHFHDTDIISIMNKTRDDVITECKKYWKKQKQVPCSEDNFDVKKFYITRGFE